MDIRANDKNHSRSRLRSAFPIAEWLPRYSVGWLRPDFVAGPTLAAYAIPVSLAYASLAGVPPQAGLYCYLVGGIAYAVFGTSRQVAITNFCDFHPDRFRARRNRRLGDLGRQSELAMAVAVLTGIIGVIAWFFRLGNIANFVSETVLSGFKVGAGLCHRFHPTAETIWDCNRRQQFLHAFARDFSPHR